MAAGRVRRAARRTTSSPAPTAGTGTCWPRAPTRRGCWPSCAGAATGLNRGRGGSMHAADFGVGMLRRERDRRRGGRDRHRRGVGPAATGSRPGRGELLRRRRGQPGRAAGGVQPGRAVAGAGACSCARTTAAPPRMRVADAVAGSITGRARGVRHPGGHSGRHGRRRRCSPRPRAAVERARAGERADVPRVPHRTASTPTTRSSTRRGCATARDEEIERAGAAATRCDIQGARLARGARERIDAEVEALLDDAVAFALESPSPTRSARSTTSTRAGCDPRHGSGV